jgi:thiamine-phosphate pyrophosphorylase
VVTAAGKRLGEALRTIEEYLKTTDPAAASKVEAIRYRFYAVEQQIAQTLRPAGLFAHVRLYVLITQALCNRPWLEAAELAIEGGADCLQLREKDLESGELLQRARQLVELCRKHRVISIINDRPDIAILSGADGVHVGQGDLPCTEARKLLGRDKIIGVSTHQLEHARQAVRDGADYIGVGPVFHSSTKPRDFLPGLDYARQIAAAKLPIPAIAIAGITTANVDEVIATGVHGIAVTAAVVGAEDICGAAKEFSKHLHDRPVGQTFLSVTESASGDTPVPRADSDHCDVEKTRRHLPHWQSAGATYFVTFRVVTGELSMPERLIVLDHIRSGDGKFYRLLAAVVMPDHAHMLLEPLPGFDLSRIMKGIKGPSARLVNEHRKTSGTLWQDESFDRILRDQNEFEEKLEYVVNNAAKRELVIDPWEYPALYVKGA